MTLGAWAYGLAWKTSAGAVLDSWFPQAELVEDTTEKTELHPAGAPPEFLALAIDDAFRAMSRVTVKVVIPDLSAPPLDVYDTYLRLHLLSMRKVTPHGLNLEGIFGILPNVVWTNHGPCVVEDFERTRLLLMQRGQLQVYGIDKFPRMVDYVIPTGVRIADANRVRLGAHLAAGTTVMHEGFVNFNAGTLGNSMVEGRISAGVTIGEGSDVGGGASIMGTLSGGGKEVITIGEHCLIGANAGVGISLGNDSVVEAGLYITAGTKITLPNKEIVKGKDLSGQSGLLFIRDSTDGAVKAFPRKGEGIALNSVLHAN